MSLSLGGDPMSTILGFARPSAVDLMALSTNGRSVAHPVLKEPALPTLRVKGDRASGVECRG